MNALDVLDGQGHLYTKIESHIPDSLKEKDPPDSLAIVDVALEQVMAKKFKLFNNNQRLKFNFETWSLEAMHCDY